MKTCIIINPNAGSVEDLEVLLQSLNGHTCWKVEGEEDGGSLAQRALAEGYDRVVAAGGDGTINAVVNGLALAGRPVTFGVLPLGTGNDLARTLAIPFKLEEAVTLLGEGAVRALDLIRVTFGRETRYAINGATGGFSGQVEEKMTPELKEKWGPFAYVIGAASALPDLTRYEAFVRFDDEPEEVHEVSNVIVANGRTAAGGARVAPIANPEDGLLDVVLVTASSVLELAEVSARLLAGKYLGSPHVLHRQVRRFHLRSRPGMWFKVDGELLTDEPVLFEVEPGRMPVIVGPEYKADRTAE